MSSNSMFGGFGVTVPPNVVTSFIKYVFNGIDINGLVSMILLELMSSMVNGLTTMSNVASGKCYAIQKKKKKM